MQIRDCEWLDNIRVEDGALPGMISVNDIQGYMCVGDIRYLYSKAMEIPKNGIIVEIGSWMGLSAITMANGLNAVGNYSAQIFCIDHWQGSAEHQLLDIIQSDGLYETFCCNIKKADVQSMIHPIRKASCDAANEFDDHSVDMVFVDGDHSDEACYNDLESWYPKLKPGGILIGHDCCDSFGVPEAVERFSNMHALTYRVLGFPETHYIYEIIL